MSTASLIKKSDADLSRYSVLRKRVRETIAAGKLRARRAVERENVRTAWETGQLILAHERYHQDKTGYGTHVRMRLSRDLQISSTELSYSVQFAEAYPIFPAPEILAWSHYKELLNVNDPVLRNKWADRSIKYDWSHKELRREIRSAKLKKQGLLTNRSSKQQTLEVPSIGQPNVYSIRKAEDGPWKGRQEVDLGFACYLDLKTAKLREKKIIIAKIREKTFCSVEGTRIDKGNPPELFNYRAWVLDVIDGDTIRVRVDLGFGQTIRQRLRFKDINTPELPSKAGERAKKYLSRILNRNKKEYLLIKTSKSDQYDRYLADVFLPNGDYVNQKLVDADHARVV